MPNPINKHRKQEKRLKNVSLPSVQENPLHKLQHVNSHQAPSNKIQHFPNSTVIFMATPDHILSNIVQE